LEQIIEFFRKLLDPDQFMPRWVCGSWTPFHGWLYIISDMVIFLAYMAIPVAMVYFVRKRWDDLPFRHVFWLFIAFIALCGTTHLLDAVIFYVPLYRFNALVLVATAIVSVATVGSMLKVIPEALKYKSPNDLQSIVAEKTAELEKQKSALSETNLRLEREMRENLRSQREMARLAAIVRASDDSILSLTTEGIITSWNDAAERMYGYSAEETIGQSITMLSLEDGRKVMEEVLDKLREGHSIDHFETPRLRKDGGMIHVSVSYSPLRDEHGVVTGISGIARDITRERQAAEEQKHLMHELERANKDLEDFAYITSHDLKAPLRAIGSLTEWIQTDNHEKLNDEGKQYLKLLRNRVHRMNELIDGILGYSRVGRAKGKNEKVNINTLIKEVLELIHVPSDIKVTVQEGLPVLMTQKTYPMQVFENLINNAIKYCDKENGSVVVGVEELPRFWKFYVKDNGMGINPRYHERIFEIFQTLKSRDEVEGTGIGLTIVKKIVTHQGGEIWVESEPEKGSTFFFTWPKQ
jgi:two-component system, LuxR family, sensor kinase FixL